MPFFTMNDAATQRVPSKTTSADHKFARRLRALVVKMASRVRPWRESKWANEFRLLTDEFLKAAENQKFVEGFPEMASKAVRERIDTVLTWYEVNYEKEGVPKLLSAAMFRKHFDWIERLSKQGVAISTENVPQKVADSAKFVVLPRVAKYPWGKGTDKLERSVIMSCLQRERIAHALSPLKNNPTVGKFVSYVWSIIGSDQFVVNWFEVLWRRLKDWKEWGGSFAGFELNANGKLFHDYMEDLATKYGDRSIWRKVCVLANFKRKGE